MGSPHRPACCTGDRESRQPGLVHGFLNGVELVADAPRTRAPAGGDDDYPAGLRDLRDAPPRVHLRGARVPPPGRCVAIVGSRAASPYGSAIAERLARDLAALGLTVVSGFARGIDAAAHRGALAGGGGTIAVVASGLDRVAAEEHDGLGARIAEHGTFLSEIAAGPPFGRGAFVRRNRLIAALAGATVVVEAAERSGALSTAAVAKQLGRALLAVPGDLDRPTSRGTFELLRAGAKVCGSAADVLAVMPSGAAPGDTTPLGRVRAALDGRPRPAGEVAARAGPPLPEVLALLLRLEWAHVASASPGQRWRRAGDAEP